jgi:diguanylate cyclase
VALRNERRVKVMKEPHSTHASTMALAEAALGQIATVGQAADPKSFELWYNFVAGKSGLLCAAVNSKLDNNGALSSTDIANLYRTYISPADIPGKIDNFGARLADEIEQVMAMIAAAEDSASGCSMNLVEVSQQLGTAIGREGVRTIVESLVLASKEMEASNLKLHERLQALWDEVGQLRAQINDARIESLTDALTGLGNRRFFNLALEKSVAECHAENAPLALLLADVDHFKAINDTSGHVIGDRVLRYVANTLSESVKGQDTAACTAPGSLDTSLS